MAESADRETEWDRIRGVVQEHQSALIRYATSIVGGTEQAKDIVQEVFLKLCKQRWRDVEGHLASWLFRVTRNQALDALRKEKRMSLFEKTETMETLAGFGEIAVGETRKSETIRSLLELVEQLPGRDKEVVTLKFQQGLSYKEISEVTGLTVSNVGYVLHHALKELKQRWEAVEEAVWDRRLQK